MKKIISKSEEQTKLIGEKIAKSLKGGDILSLRGDLGAGKTVLTRGICAGLGIKKGVKSPTFTIMNVYSVSKHKNIKRICHIDAYRLTGPRDLEAIGAEEYFQDKETVSLIEWGEKIAAVLPRRTKKIQVVHREENIREITLSGF